MARNVVLYGISKSIDTLNYIHYEMLPLVVMVVGAMTDTYHIPTILTSRVEAIHFNAWPHLQSYNAVDTSTQRPFCPVLKWV